MLGDGRKTFTDLPAAEMLIAVQGEQTEKPVDPYGCGPQGPEPAFLKTPRKKKSHYADQKYENLKIRTLRRQETPRSYEGVIKSRDSLSNPKKNY